MTSKRPLSDSSFAEVQVSNPSYQVKKVKADDVGMDSLLMNIDPIHADIRTAVDIKKALDHIHRLQRLGYCPTKVQKFRKYFDIDMPYSPEDASAKDEEASDTDEEESSGGTKSEGNKGFKSRDVSNQAILDELMTVYEDTKSLSTSYTCGEFGYDSFKLHITRPGCEYNGHIGRFDEVDGLLPDWFEHSAISGYGDMQSLETKVDSEVRNAREIPASEFEVEPKFLEKIQNLWGEYFLPRKVRAEPYKIHLYGPGGHFKSHRDTPETGLVGTFLAGLGDTSSTGNFRIGDKTLGAKKGTWVAFHPDVPHEVMKLEDGHRAVVAFKIFRMDDNEPDVLPAQLEDRVKRILDQIPAPFGLLTSHQYSIGTTSPNGFDTLLLAYARSRTDIQAHMLPVVTQFSGEAYDRPEDGKSLTESNVYPFTRAHVDIVLEKNVGQAKKEVRWLKEWSNIPFYTWDIATLEVWSEDHPDGANFTGNEADSQREDSVYLSHAILFLPKTPDDDMKE